MLNSFKYLCHMYFLVSIFIIFYNLLSLKSHLRTKLIHISQINSQYCVWNPVSKLSSVDLPHTLRKIHLFDNVLKGLFERQMKASLVQYCLLEARLSLMHRRRKKELFCGHFWLRFVLKRTKNATACRTFDGAVHSTLVNTFLYMNTN